MLIFVTVSEFSYFTNRIPTKFKVFIIMKTCRTTMSAPRAFRCRPSLPKYLPLQGLNSISQYLTLTHLLQPPVDLHSLAFQRFTQVLPWKNPQYHYFPQSLLLQPLNHLRVLLHNLLCLIHTQIICTDLHNNRPLLVTSLLNLWNHLLYSSSWFTHCVKSHTLLLQIPPYMPRKRIANQQYPVLPFVGRCLSLFLLLLFLNLFL